MRNGELQGPVGPNNTWHQSCEELLSKSTAKRTVAVTSVDSIDVYCSGMWMVVALEGSNDNGKLGHHQGPDA